MKSFLQTLMETHNQSSSVGCELVYLDRPKKLLTLFQKYHIASVFDSGCKDRHWMRHLDYTGNNIRYIGGEISQYMVDITKELFPEVEILQHDATEDRFPDVDLLFSSDVMIHLNNNDKLKFLKNFCSSNIKYLLMSDSGKTEPNVDPVYREDFQEFPFAHVTWCLPPWNFPPALDSIGDPPGDQGLKLWTREQVKQAIDKL